MLLNEYIENNYNEKRIYVLKGYSVEDLGYQKIDLKELLSTPTNKLNRLMEIVSKKVKAISFEEFIALHDLLLATFEKICIIDNNIYINLFPIGVAIEEEINSKLLLHFDEDVSDDCVIGELKDFTEIYANYRKINSYISCVFNYEQRMLDNEKIEIIYLNREKAVSGIDHIDPAIEYRSLNDETDYFLLTQDVSTVNSPFCVNISNYIDESSVLKRSLNFLAFQTHQKLYLYEPILSARKKTCSAEVYKVMEDVWGYTHFRNLKVYDFNKAQEGTKTVVETSQEDIVYDLISEVETSVVENNLTAVRDIFVTAPTGAGKSIMFQLPAIYLAQKYHLLTIVVSPLIALMNDQVKNLRDKGYERAATVNSDIAPIIKQEIFQKVMDDEIDILYLSPESLLSRSDIEQLIGKRDIGLFIVDEAHIVTTWGKQFRPDYWFLGDYIDKIRKKQMRRENGRPFIIGTFTATAIYGGIEDMYRETINSLHLIDPISYLGYVKRDNISIEINEVEAKKAKTEYEKDKFESIIALSENFLLRNQKVLVYFPLVGLIERCYDYFKIRKMDSFVAKYYGPMSADDKNENLEDFRNGNKLIMLATKAFGMGIDIPDIATVIHFAPTGNVCDYMQEIGRAARKEEIDGHAIYEHMSNDFKHINRLHGMSAIQKWQLTEVISKILDLYIGLRFSSEDDLHRTKKRNAILVDVNSFSYIFDSSDRMDESDLMPKVKTAMLLIQKDYEKKGFAPFVMRPSPLFSYGFFSMDDNTAHSLSNAYKGSIKLLNADKKVYRINLQDIWKKEYKDKYSFPQFKYLIYSRSEEVRFNQNYDITPALQLEIKFNKKNDFLSIFSCIKEIINSKVITGEYVKKENLILELKNHGHLSKYKAENIINVLMASINRYQFELTTRMNSKIYDRRESRGDANISESYRFKNTVYDFFAWIEHVFKFINKSIVNDEIYSIEKDEYSNKEITVVLGLLEAMGILKFKALGGENSQLYIYVNETKSMQIVKDNPEAYRNKLLEMVGYRHRISVKMMSYLFQHKFTSDQIWDHLENYFLGILPKELQEAIE